MPVLAAVVLTAVSSCEEKIENCIYYYSLGTLETTSFDVTSLQPAGGDYEEAILSVLGADYVTEEMDTEVIAACDAVYEEHKAMIETYDLIASGKIEIYKSTGDDSDEVIRTYTYDF